MRRSLISLVLVALVGASLRALFVAPELENVPVDRLIENLERQLAQDPADIQTRLNLARLHAMAFASKSDTAPVTTGRRGDPARGPWFGFDPSSFSSVRVQPTSDAARQAVALNHLNTAVTVYDAVLRQEPDHAIAKLGRAWCVDQTRDKAAAIAAYRDAMQTAWAKESGGNLPRLQNLMPLTVEIARYLIPLLDPQTDADEIAELTRRSDRIRTDMRRRPVTPIAIPLMSRTSLDTLVDRQASVTFDADGSGVPMPWSWITPDAGWLVFDRHQTGRVTSALQLFGSVSFWLFWDTGFSALRALDGNGDGDLAGRELAGLSIWRDANRNGISEPGEVQPLAYWKIVTLSSRSTPLDDEDAVAVSQHGVTFENGDTRPTFDVLLYATRRR